MKGVVWITEGTSLVRCASQRSAVKRTCIVTDTEDTHSQDLVGRLPHWAFLDRLTHYHLTDDSW